MSKIFKPRRGLKSTFTTGSKSNTILDEGEIFFEVPDDGQGKGRCRIKMGDGSSTYATLPYAIPFTEDEIIVHNGTDTKSVSASSSIGSSTVSTYLNNAKSGNTLKTIIHNLREAIYRNACDIVYLNNKKASTSHTHSQYAYYSDLYKQAFSKTVTYYNSYVTTGYTKFSAPKTGFYYMHIDTQNVNTTPFLRLGIVGKYVYEAHGAPGTYRYLTSPLYYITSGSSMIAQASSGTGNSLCCLED